MRNISTAPSCNTNRSFSERLGGIAAFTGVIGRVRAKASAFARAGSTAVAGGADSEAEEAVEEGGSVVGGGGAAEAGNKGGGCRCMDEGIAGA